MFVIQLISEENFPYELLRSLASRPEYTGLEAAAFICTWIHRHDQAEG